MFLVILKRSETQNDKFTANVFNSLLFIIITNPVFNFFFSCHLMLIGSTVDSISLLPQNIFLLQLNIYMKELVNIWDAQLLIYS